MVISVTSVLRYALPYSKPLIHRKVPARRYHDFYVGLSFLHRKSQSAETGRKPARPEFTPTDSGTASVLRDGAFPQNIQFLV
jgi:hypothetical protein